MKIFKFCLLPIMVLLLGTFIVGMFMPEEWNVEVRVEIKATPAEIHAQLATPKLWPEWLAPDQKQGLEFAFEGEESGVGAVMITSGNGANIRWEITASDPQRGVWFDEVLEGNANAKGAITLEPLGNSTLVTWLDRGSIGDSPVMHLFHPLMESRLTEGFRANLESLKAKLE